MRAAILVLAAAVAVQGRIPEPPAKVAIRVTPGRPTTVQVELTNVSSAPVDADAKVDLVVERLAGTPGPEYSSTIYTSVDPTNGQYRMLVPGEPPPRLTLAVGEVRTITVDLAGCKWSYRYIGNRTPANLRDVAESGSYSVRATLLILDHLTMPSSARPVQIRIVV